MGLHDVNVLCSSGEEESGRTPPNPPPPLFSSFLRRGCCPNRAELLAGCVAPSVSCDAALVEKAIVEGCDEIGLHRSDAVGMWSMLNDHTDVCVGKEKEGKKRAV